MLNFEEKAKMITLSLNGHWHGSYGVACCPAHEDSSPSLALSNGNDGRLLLHCHAGCSFTDIMDALRQKGIIERKPDNFGRPQNLTKPDIGGGFNHDALSKRKAEAARKLWGQSLPIKDTIAERYLRGRSINCALPHSLRFHGNCRHPNGQYYPAMIALVTGAGGFAVHRTYLTNTGDKAAIAPVKAMLGWVAGGSVHLTNIASNRLIICEGIETGLSLNCGMLSKPANIWAALSTSGMKAINLPDQAGELIVAFDGDKAGLEAGKALIDKARGVGWTIKTATPPQGQDFNDVLRALVAANKGGEA